MAATIASERRGIHAARLCSTKHALETQPEVNARRRSVLSGTMQKPSFPAPDPRHEHTKRREPLMRMALVEFRRRPTLPGRFQPSTISVLRLNFCVRDGNRWIPQAIVTGNMGLSSRSATLRVSLDSLRLRFPFLAPSKPHRFGSLRLTDQVRLRSPLTFFTNPLVRAPVPGLIPAFRLRSRAGFQLFLFPVPFCLFPFSPRSSPRPISITKLHTLPHFHR